MAYRYFTIEFVYADEATPRDLNAKTVRTTGSATDAEIEFMAASILRGDRIMITSVTNC